MAVLAEDPEIPARAEAEQTPTIRALIREDIEAVLTRDPAARNKLEVLCTYPGIHAILIHRLSHWLWLRERRFPARFLSFIGRFWTNIDIHPGATIGRRLFIDHGAGVVIGETAEVGNDVTLYHGVTLGGTSASRGKRHPTLRDNILVGAGAKILGPVTIGSGASVGANSVVIGDVPPGMTVVGIPGRVVLPADRRRVDGGIDLDHHLMPDPVGRAMSCLIDRINHLEKRLAEVEQAGGVESHSLCEDCEETCVSLPSPKVGGDFKPWTETHQ